VVVWMRWTSDISADGRLTSRTHTTFAAMRTPHKVMENKAYLSGRHSHA
jgi:head-tail adaptor